MTFVRTIFQYLIFEPRKESMISFDRDIYKSFSVKERDRCTSFKEGKKYLVTS